ncbi:MAG: DUF1343 domain-containing protein [Puniceicoccales bacterium]|jgi:uncharacterized protein YbbC (DUF1343 family)|nr:DUF1343 domain-containing protein [Puniceicoccales bacterium]
MKVSKILLSFLGIFCLIGVGSILPFRFQNIFLTKPTVKLGIDVLEERGFDVLQGKSIGVLTNQAGVNGRGDLTWKILKNTPGFDLKTIFAPVHGLDGKFMSLETFYNDEIDNIPIYSVFASNSRPKNEWLRGLDAVVVDLQDIGIRYYNYWGFMVYMMAACFENNIEVIVLDRPNPLGGHYIGGPAMNSENTSIWGPIADFPLFHGMTIGEIANYCKNSSEEIIAHKLLETGVPYSGIKISHETLKKGKLTVIPMEGWRRDMRWEDTGLKWVRTSPYIFNLQSVYEYAFTALSALVALDYFDTCNFLKFESSWSSWQHLHLFSSRYISSVLIMKYLNEEVFKNYSQYGFSLSARGDKGNFIEIEVKDIRKVKPALFGLAMLALSKKYTRFYVNSEDVYRFIGAHIGDNELLQKLCAGGEEIDVSYFAKKWDNEAQNFIEKSKVFYFYE